MRSSAPVNCAAPTRFGRDVIGPGPSVRPVAKTVAIVSTNKIRFSRHLIGSGSGAEGVSERGGESFELRSELGIDGSEIRVQSQAAALQRSVTHDGCYLSDVQEGDVTLERGDVGRMGFDADRARALCFGQRLPRELRDGFGVDAERLAEETLGEHAGELDASIELRLGRTLFARAEREVLGGELRLLGFGR